MTFIINKLALISQYIRNGKWGVSSQINCARHTLCLTHSVPDTVPDQGGVILYSAILR